MSVPTTDHSISIGCKKGLRLSWRTKRKQIRRWFNKITMPLAGKHARLKRTIGLLKHAQRFHPGRTKLDDSVWFYPDATSFAHAYEQIYLCGIYDIGNKVGPNPRIIDCGANVGLATLYWKTRYPNAKITALEADPAIYAYLAQNVAQSSATDLEILNLAIWSKPGELWFMPQGADSGSIVSSETSGAIRIEAVSLAEILSNGPVDLLKMDIEGAECDVIVGAESALANVQRIFVEYHSFIGKAQRLDELLATLRRAGFRVQIHPELISLQPFVQLPDDSGMDHRLNIYAWRI